MPASDESLPVPELPKLPDRISNGRDFYDQLVVAARTSVPYVGAVAGLEFPPYVDRLEKAVVRGHFIRLCKLLDGFVTLLESGRFDTSATLARSIMEIVINVEFLLNSGDVSRASRGFVCRSAEALLKPLDFFEARVTPLEDPDGASAEEFEAFLRSINPIVDARVEATTILARGGVIGDDEKAEEFLTSGEGIDCLKAWPAKLWNRAKGNETSEAIYKIWFSKYSFTTHASWRTMWKQDLWVDLDNVWTIEEFPPEPLDLIDPLAWAADTAHRFCLAFDTSASRVLGDQLREIREHFLAASRLKHKFED